MIDERQSFRLHKQFSVAWSIPGQKTEGEGTVSNISLAGMLFVTDKLFTPEHDLTMNFSVTQAPPFPSQGRIKWFKKAGNGKAGYRCGVKFPTKDSRDPAWIKWMEDNILKLAVAEDSNILARYLGQGME